MWIHSIPLATRATPITPENKSTAVTIATWLLMVVFVIMFLSREAIKYVVVRKFGMDDIFILLATVCAIGLSVTILIIAGQGLGVLGDLTVKRANALMKGYYASDFLYIASLCFAKLSLVTFFYSIVVQRAQRRAVQVLGIFIIVWTSASLITVGFQCGLPRPWEMMTLHCYNSGLFWIVYCIIDMTTDVAIIMLSVNLVAYLKVKLARKFLVIACFAPRLLVIGAALARLIYLYPVDPHDNPQFHLWVPVICTQVQVCLTISTACIPYMKPFFEGVEAGVWRVDDVRRKGMTGTDIYAYGSGGYLNAHKKGKEAYSMDSTVANSLRYGRTPDVSPRIPSPAPLSPLTPPQYNSSNSSNSSRSPSERGLRLHIPPPGTRVTPSSDVTSPQTASSIALSPNCLSPQPLLSPPRTSPNRGPSPPPRSHSPRPLVSSSHYGSPDPNSNPDPKLLSPPRTPDPSTFPQPPSASPGRYSLIPQVYPTPPPIIPRPTSQHRKRVSMHRMPPNTAQPRVSKPQFPPRSSSRQRSSSTPKYGVAPDPSNPSPSATIPSYYTKTPPTQSMGSPPSIPSYYIKTPPTSNPATFPPTTPPSPQRRRNQRILSPQNSSRREQISPVSPGSPPTPMTFWREDTSSSSGGATSAGSAIRTQRPWEVDEMPIVQDARSSPRIVIQRSD